jgi:hypothetical protein
MLFPSIVHKDFHLVLDLISFQILLKTKIPTPTNKEAGSEQAW